MQPGCLLVTLEAMLMRCARDTWRTLYQDDVKLDKDRRGRYSLYWLAHCL